MLNIINLSSYETPEAIADPRKGFVAYGEDNDYYSFLIETYLHSATANAAIRSISEHIYGEGLSILEKEPDSQEVLDLLKIVKQKDLKKIILERKLLGQSAAQIIYTGSGNSRKVKEIKHFPIHTLRPEKANAMGEIEAYFYHHDWKNYNNIDTLKRIPAFGHSTESIELYILKPYLSGHTYFSPVDYSGSLGYAELECQISNYHLNDIQNGFSGTKVINFNNGTPSKEARDLITRDVKQKLTGARGEKVIVAFNESKDNKTTVEDLPLNDAPAHYEYLATEARNKILVGHRITSPMLLGIKDGASGLGNNADEIQTSSQLFNSTVIKPFQNEVIEFLEEVLDLNGGVKDMYFITIQPIEFNNDEELEDGAEKEERTGVKSKGSQNDSKDTSNKETKLSANSTLEDVQAVWLDSLNELGEDEDSDFELISSEVDSEELEGDNYEKFLNKPSVQLSAMQHSAQDTAEFKVRYAYVHRSTTKSESSKTSSRDFCRTLVAANRVYRKEDILAMKGMNTELGHDGQPYSIWKHAGGVNCYHGWERRIYKKKIKKNGEPYSGKGLGNTKKVNVNQAKKQGFKAPINNKDVAKAEIDKANKGHHPAYNRNKK
jgi:hypothetical protein